MANRYWRGGAGTWDTATTTNWSTSSGGAGGASVPTAADSVFFDQAGTYTVTCTGALACLDITVSAGTVTFAQGTSPTFAISGSMSLVAATVWSATGTLTFNATTTGKTVTTNGVSISGAITFNGAGGGWTLGSALTIPIQRTLTVTQGTFSTSASNFALTIGAFSGTGSSTRTISLNGSTVTLNGTNSTTWNFTTTTNLTFNAGTSTIQTTSIYSSIFRGGAQTYNIVIFNNNSNSSALFFIYGANTFATLTFSTLAANGNQTYALDANQTVTGTLTLGSTNTAVRRLGFLSSTRGTQRTLTAATIGTLSDVDFQDIIAAGVSSPWSAGTRLGNGGNNTNITFPAAKTVYWNLGGTTQNWSSTGWATTSGGTPAVNNFPLAQDTAIFDATGTVPSTSVGIEEYWIGTLNTSGRTTPSKTMTLNLANALVILFGDWVTGTGVTISGTAPSIYFFGRGVTQKITSSGQTFVASSNFSFDTVSGTVQLQDSLIIDAQVSLDSGTLDLNNNNLTLTTTNNFAFSSSNSVTRAIAFGTAGINISNAGTSVWDTTNETNLTTTGTTKIVTIGTGSTTCSVSTGSLSEANAVSFKFNAGTYTLTFLNSAANTAKSVDFTGFAGTWAATSTATLYGDLTLATGMTLTTSASAMTFGATSGTQTITSNTKTIDFPITKSGAGTLIAADALTLGSTRALTFALGTIQLKAGATSTVGSFATSGTTLKYLQSTTSGTQATISDASGTNTVTYLSIKDSAATGGATFDASAVTNVNAGNNTGWTGLPISLALTGAQASGAVNTVTPTQTVTLTGVSASGSVGRIVPALGTVKILSGVQASGAVGTVTPTQTVVITGVLATGSVGTITTLQEISQTITGVSSTGSVGTITTSQVFTRAITGVQADGAVGAVTTSQAFSKELTGVQAAGSVGTIIAIPGTALPLSGVSASGAVDTVTSVYYLTGVFANGEVGTIATSQEVSITLGSNQALGNIGSVTTSQQLTRALTGVSASGSLGTVIPVGWFNIDNAQTANWGIIDNAQTGTWTLVGNAQTNTWQLIDNATL